MRRFLNHQAEVRSALYAECVSFSTKSPALYDVALSIVSCQFVRYFDEQQLKQKIDWSMFLTHSEGLIFEPLHDLLNAISLILLSGRPSSEGIGSGGSNGREVQTLTLSFDSVITQLISMSISDLGIDEKSSFNLEEREGRANYSIALLASACQEACLVYMERLQYKDSKGILENIHKLQSWSQKGSIRKGSVNLYPKNAFMLPLPCLLRLLENSASMKEAEMLQYVWKSCHVRITQWRLHFEDDRDSKVSMLLRLVCLRFKEEMSRVNLEDVTENSLVC